MNEFQMFTECQRKFAEREATQKDCGYYSYLAKGLLFIANVRETALPRLNELGLNVQSVSISPYSHSIYISTNIGTIRVSDHHCKHIGENQILTIRTSTGKVRNKIKKSILTQNPSQ